LLTNIEKNCPLLQFDMMWFALFGCDAASIGAKVNFTIQGADCTVTADTTVNNTPRAAMCIRSTRLPLLIR